MKVEIPIHTKWAARSIIETLESQAERFNNLASHNATIGKIDKGLFYQKKAYELQEAVAVIRKRFSF